MRKKIGLFARLWTGLGDLSSHNDEDGETMLTLFQQQESTILNQVSDKTERLRQLHERIVVLRGAVFSGFVLFLISLFAYFARLYGQARHWIRTVCGTLLALGLTAFALVNGYQDLKNRNIFDIPVLESLLGIITIFGGILVARGVKTQLFLRKRFLLTVAFFAALAYAAWMSSEITYDQQVISSFVVVQSDVETPKRGLPGS